MDLPPIQRSSAELLSKLFQDLPEPQTDPLCFVADIPSIEGRVIPRYVSALSTFCTMASYNNIDEPIFNAILEQANLSLATHSIDNFSTTLAMLYLKHPEFGRGDWVITRQLQYYGWVAQGRKDETWPLSAQLTTTSNNSPATPISHAFLPKSPGPVKCANCGRDGARTKCRGCLVYLEGHIVFETVYCNKTCLSLHKEHHKQRCRDWKILKRATSILRELYVHQRSTLHELTFTAIKEEEDGAIYSDSYFDAAHVYKGGHVFTPLPDHLVSSVRQKEALALLGGCHDVLHTARSLFELLIRPSCSVAERVYIVPKNMHSLVHQQIQPLKLGNTTGSLGVDILSTMKHHDVMRVTMPSGVQVAIDITSIQYGWKDYLTPWEQFAAHRIQRIKIIEPMNSFQHQAMLQAARVRFGQYTAEATAARERATLLVSWYLRDWLANHHFTNMTSLLRLPRSTFVRVRRSLVRAGKQYLNRCAWGQEHSQELKFYLDGNLGVHFTNGIVDAGGQTDYDILKAVWFSEEEYERYKDQPERMKQMWVERFARAWPWKAN